MEVCKLLPVNKRLKQLIKEFGEDWIVDSYPRKMQCFEGEEGVRVCSWDGEHIRNVRACEVELGS